MYSSVVPINCFVHTWKRIPWTFDFNYYFSLETMFLFCAWHQNQSSTHIVYENKFCVSFFFFFIDNNVKCNAQRRQSKCVKSDMPCNYQFAKQYLTLIKLIDNNRLRYFFFVLSLWRIHRFPIILIWLSIYWYHI